MNKELVEIVLDITIDILKVYGKTDVTIVVGDTMKSINIYELMHLMKEWAVYLQPNKHALSSYPRWGNIRDYPNTDGHYYVCQHLVTGAQFEAETEPEAVEKACLWILSKETA